jgi:hypothetical protein
MMRFSAGIDKAHLTINRFPLDFKSSFPPAKAEGFHILSIKFSQPVYAASSSYGFGKSRQGRQENSPTRSAG